MPEPGLPPRAYGQRSDLNTPSPSTTYGDKAAAERQVQAVPITPAPVWRPAPPGHFMRPTELPDQPVTSGLPTGPGPGPEVLNLPGPASQGPDPDLLAAVRYLPILELIASQPDSSVSARNLVRRIRGATQQLDGMPGPPGAA